MKVKAVILLLGAENDLLEAFFRYEEYGLGEDFENAVNKSLLLLKELPEAGPNYYKQYRRILIEKYPYGIYYRIHGDRLFVNAIFYLKIDPQKILKRLGSRQRS